MFVRYEVIGLSGDYGDESYYCQLIDSEFTAEFVATKLHSGLDVITPIVEIYENKDSPIAANLAALVKFCSKKYKVPANQFVETLNHVNKKFAEHSKDIEKYLILI